MLRNSKPKFDAYPDAPLSAVSKNAAAVYADSSSTVLEKRRKQAEEPIYLDRM